MLLNVLCVNSYDRFAIELKVKWYITLGLCVLSVLTSLYKHDNI